MLHVGQYYYWDILGSYTLSKVTNETEDQYNYDVVFDLNVSYGKREFNLKKKSSYVIKGSNSISAYRLLNVDTTLDLNKIIIMFLFEKVKL